MKVPIGIKAHNIHQTLQHSICDSGDTAIHCIRVAGAAAAAQPAGVLRMLLLLVLVLLQCYSGSDRVVTTVIKLLQPVMCVAVVVAG